jgi:hypothetical protein
MHHWLRTVAFPVVDRCLIHANPFGYLSFEEGPDQAASFEGDLPMFSRLSDRLLAAVSALKAVHGKKATQECLSSVAISMKFAGMVSVTRRGTPSILL